MTAKRKISSGGPNDVIRTERPESWQSFFALVDEGGVPEDFMTEPRNQKPQKHESLFPRPARRKKP